jgi:hypothetical protein
MKSQIQNVSFLKQMYIIYHVENECEVLQRKNKFKKNSNEKEQKARRRKKRKQSPYIPRDKLPQSSP